MKQLPVKGAKMEETKRKSITKKIRFEVFKRDSFTCQYCGQMAPDVVLEVDHIIPVSQGGKNEVLNLVTSCFDCNRGKGKDKLNEKNEILKQQKQLKEMSEKREQMKMLLAWREELKNFKMDQSEELSIMFYKLTNRSFGEAGDKKVIKWLGEFDFLELIECLEISVDQYFTGTDESASKAFNFIPRIAQMRKIQKNNPIIGKRNYLKAILRKRLSYINDEMLAKMLYEVETDEDFEDVKKIINTCSSWTNFRCEFDRWSGGDIDHGY